MFAAETTYNQTPVLGFTLEEFMAAAVLHDVSEDVPEYPLSYIHAQFGVNIHDIVEGVTRHLGEEYKEFILRACENEGSRRLKLVDIRDNLSRIHLLPKAMSKLQHRYIQAEKVLLSYSNKA
jgi:(p)ppGpp synthase/HD superfamily hydrolase